MGCRLPDRIFQARILEWVAISFSRNLLNPMNPHPLHLLRWQVDSLPLNHQGGHLHADTYQQDVYFNDQLKCPSSSKFLDQFSIYF